MSTNAVLGERPRSADKPYGFPWMDSSYQETLLPGTPWHTVSRDVCAALSEHLTVQLSSKHRATVIAQLLGGVFMAEYYPDVITDLHDLDDLPPEEVRKLTVEATGWLRAQLIKAAKQVGCQKESPDSALSEDMQEFIEHTSNAFYSGLSRELYKLEREVIDAGKQTLLQSDESPHPRYNPVSQFLGYNLPDTSKQQSRDGKRESPSALSGRRSTVSSVKTERVRAALYNLDLTPQVPNMTSRSVDFIAESVVKVLERSPRRFETVAKRLHGRLLPSKLRRYMWTEVLYMTQREKLNNPPHVERILRERFGKAVARNVGDLRITRATHSPLQRVIENAVIETYELVPALTACRTQAMMQEACEALNVLYTYDKTYERYLIYWLFPLQLAYNEGERSTPGPEHVYELAMHLDLINTSLYPTWPQLSAIANYVMQLLNDKDPQLYNHLEEVSQIGANFHAKDFVLEAIYKERKEAESILKKGISSTVPPDTQRVLSDPRLYIRKWIGEGFVSVVDTPAAMLIWDQLFINDWSSRVLQDFSLVLLILLRDCFLSASDHMTMRSVFLHEPCKLLLADIQQGWLRLHKGDNYSDIAKLNRISAPRPRSGFS